MERIPVVIPSHKRADKVLTKRIVNDPIICVPEAQEAEYRKHNPECEILTHPDTVIGLDPKRDWIYNHFGDVMMLDDDISGVTAMYREAGEKSKVAKDTFSEIIQQTAFIAREIGCYLFGFGDVVRPAYYDEYKPIKLSGFVNGRSLGMLKGSGLSFVSDLTAVEDFYMSCMNAYTHRKAYIDNRFFLQQKDTFKNQGGQAEYRNMATEKKATLGLRKLFGEVIELKKDGGETARTRPYQRRMKLPF